MTESQIQVAVFADLNTLTHGYERFLTVKEKNVPLEVCLCSYSVRSLSLSDLRHGQWPLKNDLGIKGRPVVPLLVPFQPSPAILSSWILIFALF